MTSPPCLPKATFLVNIICAGVVAGLATFLLLRVALPLSASLALVLALVVLLPVVRDAIKLKFDVFSVRNILTLGLLIYFVLPAIDLTMIVSQINFILSPDLNFYGHALLFDKDLVISKGIGIVILGTIMLWVGYYFNPVSRHCYQRDKVPQHVLSLKRLLVAGCATTIVGFFAIWIMVQSVGGWSVWFSRHWARKFLERPNELILLFGLLSNFLFPGALMLYGSAIQIRSGFRRWVILSIIGFIIVVLAVFKARKWILWIFLGIMMMRHYLIRRINIRHLILLTVLSLVVLIFLSPFRSAISYSESLSEAGLKALEIIEEQPIGNILRGTTDFSLCFDSYLSIISGVPNKVAPLWGKTYIKLFLFPFPRSVLPSKPIGAGGYVVKYFYPHLSEGVSMGTTIVGEAYFNFLLPGVIMVMFTLGVIGRKIKNYLGDLTGRLDRVLIWSIVAPYFIELIRSDVFVTLEYLIILIPVVVGLKYARRKTSPRWLEVQVYLTQT